MGVMWKREREKGKMWGRGKEKGGKGERGRGNRVWGREVEGIHLRKFAKTRSPSPGPAGALNLEGCIRQQCSGDVGQGLGYPLVPGWRLAVKSRRREGVSFETWAWLDSAFLSMLVLILNALCCLWIFWLTLLQGQDWYGRCHMGSWRANL